LLVPVNPDMILEPTTGIPWWIIFFVPAGGGGGDGNPNFGYTRPGMLTP
jgi:hypothetical protein